MAKDKQKDNSRKLPSAKEAFDNLDRVFHEKARLGILTSMIGRPDGVNFNELKELCELTDGNLNRHMKVLLDAKVVSVKKKGQGRNTVSTYKLTANGRKTFQRYIDSLEAIVRSAQQQASEPVKGNLGLAGS